MDRTAILLLADAFRRRKKRGSVLPVTKLRLPVEITGRLIARAQQLDVTQTDIVTAALAVALPEQPNGSNTVAAPGHRSEGDAP